MTSSAISKIITFKVASRLSFEESSKVLYKDNEKSNSMMIWIKILYTRSFRLMDRLFIADFKS
jgi:hypothetical protein